MTPRSHLTCLIVLVTIALAGAALAEADEPGDAGEPGDPNREPPEAQEPPEDTTVDEPQPGQAHPSDAADTDASPPPKEPLAAEYAAAPARRGSWFTYGGVILLADVGILAAASVTDAAMDNAFPMWGYLATGPVVHMVHDHPGRALGSLGLRVGLPVAGAFTGAALMEDDGWGALVGAALGVSIGGVAAIGLDAIWLGRHPKPALAAERDDGVRARIFPSAGVSKSGLQLGLSGSF